MSDAVNPFANVKIAVEPKTAAPETVAEPAEQGTQTPLTQTERPAPEQPKPVSRKIEPKVREKIKAASIDQGYRSDARPKKETTKTHAYTFYPSDIRAIRRIKMDIMEEDISVNISDSEVMRAAIAALNALPYEDQKRLIQEQKER